MDAPLPRRDPLRAGVTVPGLALAAAGSSILGFLIGSPWLLPILNAAPAFAVMVLCLKLGRRATAVWLMIWWAACLGAAATLLCAADPWGTASRAVLHGPPYLAEMRTWTETGAGCESSPGCFVPRHLLSLGLFAALALATASAAAMTMGAILMNYMSYYVGSIAATAVSPVQTILLGWHPWSLVRIVSFVTLGVVLAEPLVARVTRSPALARRGVWVAWAMAGIVLDMILKTILAPHWAALLRAAVGG